MTPSKPVARPYSAFQQPDFRKLLLGRFFSSFGGQILTFSVAWELWLRTHSAFALGMVGLVEVLPIVLFSLPAGALADRRSRRTIILAAQTATATCGLLLAGLSLFQGPIVAIYAVLFLIGLARAFGDPAASTLIPLVVPPKDLTNAATWNSSAFQTASILGPAAAGLIVGLLHTVWPLYLVSAACSFFFLLQVARIKARPVNSSAQRGFSLNYLLEGFRFLRQTKIILAAITLDLFAVLFGGAVALLPIFATDILKVGPDGLGILRAAASAGAVLMGLAAAHLPPLQKAGRTLLLAVAGFGVATILFGLSTFFWFSVAMLFLLGALDNISVVIRSTLMLTRVPDAMRGRAAAVNSIFISASNELGDFESGMVAALLGPVAAVVVGGIGTLVVVLVVARVWPEIARLKTLDAPPST